MARRRALEGLVGQRLHADMTSSTMGFCAVAPPCPRSGDEEPRPTAGSKTRGRRVYSGSLGVVVALSWRKILSTRNIVFRVPRLVDSFNRVDRLAKRRTVGRDVDGRDQPAIAKFFCIQNRLIA